MRLNKLTARLLTASVLFLQGSASVARSSPAEFNSALGCGINLGNALEAPKEGDWGVTLQSEYFPLIKNAGFKHVRVPIRWSAHAQNDAPYKIDPEFFSRVDWVLKQAASQKLLVVLNMHHYEELENAPDTHTARFIAMWQQIAEHFQNAPDTVAFEIYNEPSKAMDDAHWNSMLVDTLKEIRKKNPKRIVIVGPTRWNSFTKLESLKLPDNDRNLIVTVHYYEPFHFTHQGASWAGPESKSWLGTKWTDSKEERSRIEQDLDTASTWGAANSRPMYLGEFGAYEKADMNSRALWTRAIRSEAAQRNFSTAYWEFCSGFGAFDASRKKWRTPLLEALTSK